MSGWRHRKESRHERGYGTAWDWLRLAVLRRDRYLCQCAECKRTGRVRVAMEVDHIKPKAQGGSDALDNLQAINRECHRAKTMAENGTKPRPRIGVDGWPAAE